MDKLFNYKIVAKAPESNILKDLGRKILQIANEKIELDYGNNEYLKGKLSYTEALHTDRVFILGELTGSSTFLVPIVEDIVSDMGLHVVTLAGLERKMRNGEINPRGRYVDLGVTIQSEDGTNEYHAQSLMLQIRERNDDGENPEMPIYINLRDLKIINDSEAPRGLGLVLRDGAQIINAPIFRYENNNKEFSETNDDGFPIFDKNGDRILYTRQSGLSRLVLGHNLDLDSNCGGRLAGSVFAWSRGTSRGQVIIVSGEAA